MPTVRATSGGIPLDDGSYSATALEVEEMEPAGTSLGGEAWWRWRFLIHDGSRAGVELTTGSSTRFGPKSKARTWMQALLGRKIPDGEDITFEQYLPRDCTVVIRHNERDYPYVSDVLPAKGGTARPLAPEQADIPF
jgi:hypothetical protein